MRKTTKKIKNGENWSFRKINIKGVRSEFFFGKRIGKINSSIGCR